MKIKLILTMLLLAMSMLSADNWFAICDQTFSEPDNNVTSYDITSITCKTWGWEGFDSICVIAHSEKTADSTSALVVSRWYISKNHSWNNADNHLVQDTVIWEQGTVVSKVKFPAFYNLNYYEDAYFYSGIYFLRHKNGTTDLCCLPHTGDNQFGNVEVIETGVSTDDDYSVSDGKIIFSKNGKINYRSLTNGEQMILDSISCQNPRILQHNGYNRLVWERFQGDTVKTFYMDYDVYNDTLSAKKQFYYGDVRNLSFGTYSFNYCTWESGFGLSRKSYICPDWPSLTNITELANSPSYLRMIHWYSDFCSYQIGDATAGTIFLDDDFYGYSSLHIDSVSDSYRPDFKIVAINVVCAYAPWTYLKKVNGKYQLQARMLYLPEAGIDQGKTAGKDQLLVTAYPNPFNNATRINFQLPKSGITTVAVYNSSGQLVKKIAESFYSAGQHTVDFQADNLNSGVYFIRISSNGAEKNGKLLLVK